MKNKNNFYKNFLARTAAGVMCFTFIAIMTQASYASASVRAANTGQSVAAQPRNIGVGNMAPITQTRAATTTPTGGTAGIARRSAVYDYIRQQAGGGLAVSPGGGGGGIGGGAQITVELNQLRQRIDLLEQYINMLDTDITQVIINNITNVTEVIQVLENMVHETLIESIPAQGNEGIIVNHTHQGITIDVNPGPGIEISPANEVQVRIGRGVRLSPAGELEVDTSDIDLEIPCVGDGVNEFAVVQRANGQIDCVKIVR